MELTTKKDSKGNILTYDEIVFINSSINEDNYYLKYYELFPIEQFNELYNVSKEIETESQRRKLNKEDNEKIIIEDNEKLFNYSYNNLFEI